MNIFRKILKNDKTESGNKTNIEEMLYPEEKLEFRNSKRYIFLKGIELEKVGDVLEWAYDDELEVQVVKPKKYNHLFSKAKFGKWTVIKIPNSFNNYKVFHDLLFSLKSYTIFDSSISIIGISIGDETSYIVYSDSKLEKVLKTHDCFSGVFNDGEIFTCLGGEFSFIKPDKKRLKSFDKTLKKKGINLDFVISNENQFESFELSTYVEHGD